MSYNFGAGNKERVKKAFFTQFTVCIVFTSCFWLTLVIIVIAPTARSPPYLERLNVKLTDRILSVDNMTKVEIPSARHGKIMSFCNLKFSFLIIQI